MVTTNARDSRPRENLGKQSRSNENYKPKTSRESGNNNRVSVQEKRDGKSTNRSSFGGNKDKGGKTAGGYYKSKDFRGSPFNKDDDYENDNKYGKGYGKGSQRMESRSKSGQAKEKEQQPDKFETLKRLENEKKIKQKKLNQEFSNKSERPNKPLVKHRRTSNIDWTKGYEKGLYDDDDETYTEFL